MLFHLVIVPPGHLEVFFILEYMLIGYADDSTLMAVVPSPCLELVAESLIGDLGKARE